MRLRQTRGRQLGMPRRQLYENRDSTSGVLKGGNLLQAHVLRGAKATKVALRQFTCALPLYKKKLSIVAFMLNCYVEIFV